MRQNSRLLFSVMVLTIVSAGSIAGKYRVSRKTLKSVPANSGGNYFEESSSIKA